MYKFIQGVKNFWNNEEGATAIEYALMAVLIAAVIVTVVAAIGGFTAGSFTKFKVIFATAVG